MPEQKAAQTEWKSTRFWLAIGVTVISVVAVTVLAGLIIHNAAGQAGAASSAQNVLSSVLPLLGTWVGTILAYYFSKENFEAATKSVTDIAKQLTPHDKLKSLPAKDKMIQRTGMFYKALPTSSLKLVEILDDLEKQKKGNRIPVLGEKGQPKYIFHRSLIDKYLADVARSGKSADEIKALTVSDLLDHDPKITETARAFGVVKSEASLADAMEIMNRVSDCQDVFITQAGTSEDPVLGWLTNVIIQENARI